MQCLWGCIVDSRQKDHLNHWSGMRNSSILCRGSQRVRAESESILLAIARNIKSCIMR